MMSAPFGCTRVGWFAQSQGGKATPSDELWTVERTSMYSVYLTSEEKGKIRASHPMRAENFTIFNGHLTSIFVVYIRR